MIVTFSLFSFFDLQAVKQRCVPVLAFDQPSKSTANSIQISTLKWDDVEFRFSVPINALIDPKDEGEAHRYNIDVGDAYAIPVTSRSTSTIALRPLSHSTLHAEVNPHVSSLYRSKVCVDPWSCDPIVNTGKRNSNVW
jgi:hypothetical protein